MGRKSIVCAQGFGSGLILTGSISNLSGQTGSGSYLSGQTGSGCGSYLSGRTGSGSNLSVQTGSGSMNFKDRIRIQTPLSTIMSTPIKIIYRRRLSFSSLPTTGWILWTANHTHTQLQYRQQGISSVRNSLKHILCNQPFSCELYVLVDYLFWVD